MNSNELKLNEKLDLILNNLKNEETEKKINALIELFFTKETFINQDRPFKNLWN